MIYYVDVDQVCADLMTPLVQMYNKDYNDHLTVDDFTVWDMSKSVKPECGTNVYKYFRNPDIYDKISPIPYSLKGVNFLRSKGTVCFVTATDICLAGRKFKWLDDNGFKPDPKEYIEMYHKTRLRGDVIIDDKFKTVEGFQGLGILFRQPHNKSEIWEDSIDGWQDILEGRFEL